MFGVFAPSLTVACFFNECCGRGQFSFGGCLTHYLAVGADRSGEM